MDVSNQSFLESSEYLTMILETYFRRKGAGVIVSKQPWTLKQQDHPNILRLAGKWAGIVHTSHHEDLRALDFELKHLTCGVAPPLAHQVHSDCGGWDGFRWEVGVSPNEAIGSAHFVRIELRGKVQERAISPHWKEKKDAQQHLWTGAGPTQAGSQTCTQKVINTEMLYGRDRWMMD